MSIAPFYENKRHAHIIFLDHSLHHSLHSEKLQLCKLHIYILYNSASKPYILNKERCTWGGTVAYCTKAKRFIFDFYLSLNDISILKVCMLVPFEMLLAQWQFCTNQLHITNKLYFKINSNRKQSYLNFKIISQYYYSYCIFLLKKATLVSIRHPPPPRKKKKKNIKTLTDPIFWNPDGDKCKIKLKKKFWMWLMVSYIP